MKKISNKINFIIGPTGSGKTDVGVILANKMNACVISCDSRQIYKDVKIGTAKPNITKSGYVYYKNYKAKHYMFDITNLKTNFTVGDYVRVFNEIVCEVQRKGKNVLVVGGTGLYVKALTLGLSEISDIDPKIRENINDMLKKKGLEFVYQTLYDLDKKTALVIDKKNPRRVTRALEVIMQTGVPLVDWHKSTKKPELDSNIFGLDINRDLLYERINKRSLKMFKSGLITEVKNLIKRNYSLELINKAGIGYSHIVDYLNGKNSKDKTIELFKRDTRHYAKRQMTWFKKYTDIKWIKVEKKDTPEKISSKIIKKIQTQCIDLKNNI